MNDKLRWVACGGPLQPVSHTYLCELGPSRGQDTHTGFVYKWPKRGSGGNASPTGFICVCGPGLVDKPLLHRVGISRAPWIILGCHFRGSDTPHCGSSTGIYVREPIAWGSGVHLVEIGADGTYVVS